MPASVLDDGRLMSSDVMIIGMVLPMTKRKRKAPPNTPAHNFVDTAEAVLAMAKIIDPGAFADPLDIKARRRIGLRRARAMQKARDCAAAYDYHLGNQRHVTVIVQKGGQTRYYKIKRGEEPKKAAATATTLAARAAAVLSSRKTAWKAAKG